MAKPHRSKPHQIKLSESGKPHELSPQDWFDLTEKGIAKIEADTKAARVAVLRLPFIGWVEQGELCYSRIGASIKSTWIAWEREWMLSVTPSEVELQHLGFETYSERLARIERERETAALIEALEWKSTRKVKGGRNSIRWVSEDQLKAVLMAFGRMPSIANQFAIDFAIDS